MNMKIPKAPTNPEISTIGQNAGDPPNRSEIAENPGKIAAEIRDK
jgi:hypothetical protein